MTAYHKPTGGNEDKQQGTTTLSDAARRLRDIAIRNPGAEVHVDRLGRFELHAVGVYALDAKVPTKTGILKGVMHLYADLGWDPLFVMLSRATAGPGLKLPEPGISLEEFLDKDPSYGMKLKNVSPTWWKAITEKEEGSKPTCAR
ncbi:MAG: hypothetical protein LUQ69_10325 [Methanoregulaceae archaeon]|nr:hypothetical protein [Methanoregulaceae archaeon]